MMRVSAVLRGTRLSAQKGRLVADQIRGLPVDRALNILTFSPKKGAVIIKKVLESAIANAEHNEGADIDELKVATILRGRRFDDEAFPCTCQRSWREDPQADLPYHSHCRKLRGKEHGTEDYIQSVFA